MTRYAVVGAGSLGLLLAAGLLRSGCDAEVWTRSEAQARLLSAEGIALGDAAGSAFVAAGPVRATALAAVKPAMGSDTVALLTVKQTAIDDALLAALAAAVPPGGAVAAFCNGIGHFERLAGALPGRALIAAVTTEGALRTDSRTVLHTGSGHTFLGAAPLFDRLPPRDAAPPDADCLEALKSRLVQAGFEVSLSNRMSERMLRKLLVNAVINPLTSLFRVRNGELASGSARIAIMQALFDETVGILRPYGLATEEPLWEELLDVCRRTAMNQSSMLQDVLAGRKTEIEALNGAVCRLAERMDKQAPLNETIASLIRALEGA